jgi:hypothetical protein
VLRNSWVALTGSVSRSIQTVGITPLAGRALVFRLAGGVQSTRIGRFRTRSLDGSDVSRVDGAPEAFLT